MVAARFLIPVMVFSVGSNAPVDALSASTSGAVDCRLCEQISGNDEEAIAGGDSGLPAPEMPVTIDVTTRLNFSRIALTNGSSVGEAAISPQNGAVELSDGMIDLGGHSLAGTATVNGQAGRRVRVDMPASIRMTSSSGGIIELHRLQTNLGPAPRLDANGTLSFAFGGALKIRGNVSGKFRGRIPITVQYE